MTLYSELVLFSITYVLFCFCIIAPPTEFISAGITINHLIECINTNENLKFVEYHICRSTLTIIIHSFLPLGYFVGIYCFTDQPSVLQLAWSNIGWQIVFTFAILLPVTACTIAFYWSQNNWKYHPVVRNLEKSGRIWNDIATEINEEYRRVDKFVSGRQSLTRIVVTDTWIIQVTPYTLKIAQQNECILTLSQSTEFAISHSSTTGIQFLKIEVKTRQNRIKPFSIWVNSQEYSSLREKLQAPVQNAQGIIIQHTLTDRFLDVFYTHVSENPKYSYTDNEDTEPCIGCMLTPANVKLQKLCDHADAGNCQQCHCRPMWCVWCMGRWFASRQDQNRPETWLSSSCPCPTCRSVFCMLDVCLIENI